MVKNPPTCPRAPVRLLLRPFVKSAVLAPICCRAEDTASDDTFISASLFMMVCWKLCRVPAKDWTKATRSSRLAICRLLENAETISDKITTSTRSTAAQVIATASPCLLPRLLPAGADSFRRSSSISTTGSRIYARTNPQNKGIRRAPIIPTPRPMNLRIELKLSVRRRKT